MYWSDKLYWFSIKCTDVEVFLSVLQKGERKALKGQKHSSESEGDQGFQKWGCKVGLGAEQSSLNLICYIHPR